MGLPASCLPATIIEFLTSSDPELVRLARQDAAQLVAAGYAPGFAWLEQVPTLYFDLVRERLAKVVDARARRLRLGVDVARASLHATAYDELKTRFEDLGRYYHLLLNLEMAGGKIFRIAPALAERLLETRIDVPAEALRLPFRSLMLVFDDDASIAAFHEGRPFGRPQSGGSISSVLFDLNDGPRRLLAASIHTRGRHCHGMFHRSLRYDEGTLEAMLSTTWPGLSMTDLTARGRSFHRLLLNTILYIGSQAARVTPPRRDHGARDPLTRSRREHALVGDGLTPLRPAGAGHSASGPAVGRGSRDIRQLVSGHWKLQVHGAGRLERRVTWIEPYWRGPEFAQVVNRAKLVR